MGTGWTVDWQNVSLSDSLYRAAVKWTHLESQGTVSDDTSPDDYQIGRAEDLNRIDPTW